MDKIIKTSLVLVLAGGQEFTYPTTEIRQLIDEPQVVQALGEEAYRVTSMRDQLSLSVSSERITIEDLSGADPCESDFAEQASALVRALGDAGLREYRAFGTNCVIEREGDTGSSVAATIASVALNLESLEAAFGVEIRGAGVTIITEEAGDRLKLALEPRRQDLDTPILFADLNIHTADVDAQEVVDPERLKGRLCRTYKSILQMSQSFISAT